MMMNGFIASPSCGALPLPVMRTYDLMATPLIYPGQVIKSRIVADRANIGNVSVCLRKELTAQTIDYKTWTVTRSPSCRAKIG